MIPVVVLASGRGSNFDAILASVSRGQLSAEIVGVISDRAEAEVLKKAKAAGIESVLIQRPKLKQGQTFEERQTEHEALMRQEMRRLGPQFLVLAGYMKLLSEDFINSFRSPAGYARIVNIHPSVLPSFPGVSSYRQAFQYGVHWTGVTVHLVEPEMDSGPICAQSVFSIQDCKTENEVEEKGLALEHDLYPKTLKWILPENFKVEKRPEGRLFVRQN